VCVAVWREENEKGRRRLLAGRERERVGWEMA